MKTNVFETKPNIPGLVIRKMVESDIDSYSKLFQDVFAGPPWNEKWSLQKIQENINKLINKKGFTGIVARIDSVTAGYLTGFQIMFFPSVFYMDQLFVKSDYRCKGVARTLLSEACESLKPFGVSRMFLLTKKGAPAEDFYLRNGFKTLSKLIRIKGKHIFYNHI